MDNPKPTSTCCAVSTNSPTQPKPLPTFALHDADGWTKAVANNTDPYGRGVIEFAATWANLMESRMAKGESLEAIAKETSYQADTDGITGFMYGCAVHMLAHAWQHGEALRRWHNLDTQIRNEGEIANAKGTVLNPALLSIGVS